MIDIDSLLTLVFICLPLFFAIVCLYYSLSYLRSARSIEDNPTSKIRSAAQGYVELSGTVKPLTSTPVLGALTKTACAWYRYTIEEFVTISTASGMESRWNIVESAISSQPILITDGTGECVMLPQGAEIMPTRAIGWRGHHRIPDPPPTSFWLWLLWNNWGRYRYTEYRLELGIPIFASGRFSTQDAGAPLTSNPLIKTYYQENNLTTAYFLTGEDLASNQNLMLSAIPPQRLIRQFKLKAFVFFLAFLFLSVLSYHSSYPIVKQGLQHWHFIVKGLHD